MPENITRTNTNYQVSSADIASTGIVTKEYLINVYSSLAAQFKTAGLWIWGLNTVGQLGDDTRTHRSSPVQTVAGGTNWVQVAAGANHTTAIKTDGTLWGWGGNSLGQLGANNITHRSSPVQTIAGGTNWRLVSCGSDVTASIKTDGTLWVWGRNSYGQLGDNTRTHRSSPVQTVSGGTNWKQVSIANANPSYHMAAVKTDGTLWTWGHNYGGVLGDGTNTHRSSPVQTVAGGTNWKYVSAGGFHIAAIKTDSTLWTWGRNDGGYLGTNNLTHRSSPVQTISGGTNWKSVSAGAFHVSTIKTDGTLWAWGGNYNGQLGTNNSTNRSSPVQTVAAGTNWFQIFTGNSQTMALKTDGTLWMWGYNPNGQLGDNSTTDRLSPVQTISSGTNWKSAAAGLHTVAIRDDSDDPF